MRNYVVFVLIGVFAAVAAYLALNEGDDIVRPVKAPLSKTTPALPASSPEKPVTFIEPKSKNISEVIAQTRSDDADSRVAAIVALAAFPKTQAVPVLRDLLNGSPENEQQQVLMVLGELAKTQGDDDGSIRDVLRLSVYDGDESLAANAQQVLEDIESVAL